MFIGQNEMSMCGRIKLAVLFSILSTFLFVFAEPDCLAEVSEKDQEIIWKMGQPFYSGKILPSPKEVQYFDGNIVLIDGAKSQEYYSLEFPQTIDNEKLIRRLFNKHIDRYKKQFTGKWKKVDPEKLVRIKFYLEHYLRTEKIKDPYNLHKKAVILKDQGYILEIGEEGIVCIGKDNAGLVNGLSSIIQLLDVKDGNLVVHKVRIFDYPISLRRMAGTHPFPDIETLDWLLLYKLNGWSGGRWYLIDWAGLTEAQKKNIAKYREYTNSRNTLSHVPQIHLEGLRPKGKGSPRLDIGNPENVKALLNTVTEILTLGGGCVDIFILGEDSPDKYPKMPMEKEKFKTLAEAHGYILEKVWQRVHNINPYSKVYFCPPSYSVKALKDNPEFGDYLKETQNWNKNIILAWTGSSTYSVNISYEQIDIYRSLMGYERPLMLWDNTWFMRSPLSNCFIDFPEYFNEYCGIRHVDCRIGSNDPHGILESRLFCATAVDQFWGPLTFDEVETRKTAIAQFFGKEAVPYAEKYFKFRDNYYYERFQKIVNLEDYKEVLEGIGKACNVNYDDVAGKHYNTLSGVKRYMAELWDNYEVCKKIQSK